MRRPQMVEQRLLRPEEKSSIQAEIRDCEAQLNAPDLVDMSGNRTIWAPNPQASAAHSGNATQRLRHLRRVLEDGTVHDFSKRAIKKREDEIKILEERVSKRMAPHDFYYGKRADNKDYHKTVDHLVKVELDPEHQRETRRLQNLYRARSAAESRTAGARENPENGSLEHLRK